MVTEELISAIKTRFQQGERREDIVWSLQQDGYSTVDIDAAISQIRHEGLKQLPFLSSVYAFVDRMEAKTAHSSPGMTFGILGTCFLVVLVLFWGLYLILDPLGVKSGQRDTQRETDVIKLRNGLSKYYTAKYTYPSNLNALTPAYVQTIPQDPKTGQEYKYQTLDEGSNYTLCVTFEAKPPQCVSAMPSTSTIPVVNSETQVESVTDGTQHKVVATPEPSEAISPTPSSQPTVGKTKAL